MSDRRELRAALAERDRAVTRPDRNAPDGSCRDLDDFAAVVLAVRDDLSRQVRASTGDGTRVEDREGSALAAIPIADYVGACADAMRPQAEDKGLVLRCEVDPDLPTVLETDPLRLRQVLLHLIGNAVRFTEKGWISICAEPAWDDPGTLAISVTDTGIGMDGDDDGSVPGGAGVEDPGGMTLDGGPHPGIALSAEGARQMGGTLTHSSERGRGTRAELRVPLRPVGGARLRPAGRFRFPD